MSSASSVDAASVLSLLFSNLSKFCSVCAMSVFVSCLVLGAAWGVLAEERV